MKKIMAIMALALCLTVSDVAAKSGRLSRPILIYDKGELLQIYMEDIKKYHGDICPCVMVSFRATRLAVSELWKNEIPERSDFKIESSLPTDGSEDTFEFITRAKKRNDFSLNFQKGGKKPNMSEKNYSFLFTRKSTREQVRISVRKNVFRNIDENFFDIAAKVKSKKASKKEIKKFFLNKGKLKNAFINIPLNQLFSIKKARMRKSE